MIYFILCSAPFRKSNNIDKLLSDIKEIFSDLNSDKKYRATFYKDPESAGWKKKPEEVVIENQFVDSDSVLSIILPSGGGQAIRFSPAG